MIIKQWRLSKFKPIRFIVALASFGFILLFLRRLFTNRIKPQTKDMFEVAQPDNSLKRLENFRRVEERCPLPTPDILNVDALAFLDDNPPPPVNCILDEPETRKLFKGLAFTMKEGRFLHQVVDLGVPCCIKNIERNPEDNGIRNLTQQCYPITKKVTKIEKNRNYIAVECREVKTGDLVYFEAFTVFHAKEPKMVDSESSSRPKLNVLFIGMEATSQLNFFRKMPLTHAFLRDTLNAVLLRGYNKVGECTHANLTPLLAGVSTQKLEADCLNPQKQNNVAPKLDNCSFIWNKFANNGYLTFYGEDFSTWGPFDYYWPMPFRRQPTDYYLRPAAIYSDMREGYFPDDYTCMGPRFGFDIIMESIRTIVAVNKGKPFFQFVWPGSLGYKDMNHQQRGDENLSTTLKYFHDTGLLNRTALFVVGDHGFRKKGYKYTRNGAIEDRMPVAFIALPEWFRTSYPEHYANLNSNSKIMTNHFDVHNTLLDILHLDGPKNSDKDYPESGTSLFKPISSERTCLDAGIPLLWCFHCHPRQPLEEEDIKLDVAEFLVKMLNTGARTHKCDPHEFTSQNYTMDSILFASKWDPRDVQRELCSRDGKGVYLLGFFGQSSLTLNIPCESFFDVGRIDVLTVEFLTNEVRDTTFMGEVVRYRNYSDRKWNYQLTEDVQYNFIY